MRRIAASVSPTANSAAAGALRPGAKLTLTPCRVAAARSTFTGPPRETATNRNPGEAANTRSVNGAICVTQTDAPSSASTSSSSVPLASRTSATGPKGSWGQGRVSSENSGSSPPARDSS
ncbi:hypothetical protein GA0115253_105693 [Streptomyces sp. Termitarium-T10T-6]|nr:hypothetical protein GA0115253_105693 [Streptomyces sp. Termitarium-T10T-6]